MCGIVVPDGTPAHDALAVMTAALERRGPDGARHWCAGPAALGHTLLATTPEALGEALPLHDPDSGCTITADARLDNREELAQSLGIAVEGIGDGALILAAYHRWGDDCAARLLGDFAFAIWDARRARLFCARDPVGMRQLLYRAEPGKLTFATEANALAAAAGGAFALNEDRIGDFLGNLEAADYTSTCIAEVYRLPPGHRLTFDSAGLSVDAYWQCAPEPLLELESDAAYTAAFMAIFREAVRCRLRSVTPTALGAMLSGGLDSNAVVAVANSLAETPLAVFSAVGPDPACVESHAIHTAIGHHRSAATMVDHSDLGPLGADLARETADSAEPFDASMTLIRAVYLAARRAGVRVMLDGVGSDTVLASNYHTAFLLRAGRWRALWREARGERFYWGPQAPAWRTIVAAAWQALAPGNWRWRRFARGRAVANRAFAEKARVILPNLDLERALARRRTVQQRVFADDRLDAMNRVRALFHPTLVVARERYDRVAGALGIEPRDPFLDLRLIRFCLSLPLDQLQRDGWPKWVLREAMAESLPEEIRWRRGRQHLGQAFTDAVEDLLGEASDRGYPSVNHNYLKESEFFYVNRWFAVMKRQGWIPSDVGCERCKP